MKKNKQLVKLVRQLSKISFKDGQILENRVIKSIKALKALPKSQAILALSEYLKSLKRKMREHTLYIETTTPLSPAQLKRMKKIVEKKVKITKVLVNINPKIYGGFKLKIGDEIWDESILGQINHVREAIRG